MVEALGGVAGVVVDDPADPRLVDYVGLTDVSRRRRTEPEIGDHGIFIAEGEPVVRRAIATEYEPRSILLDPKRVDLLADVLPTLRVPVYLAAPDVLAAVTGFNVHRGVLASFHRKPPLAPSDVLSASRRVLVCEALTSTTNLGAVLRSAAALGIDGVLLSPECCDPLYRRAVRVSMGESLRLPIARLQPWPDALADVRAHGFTVLALTPDSDARSIRSFTLRSDARLALLLGEEGPGLTAEAQALADERVCIPMAPGVDSLNVAAAAAVACYALGHVADSYGDAP